MRVPTTTFGGPVATIAQDQIDAEFSHIVWTNFSGQVKWIIDRSGTNPVINHQRFIPGGSVTGYPNQVVP